MSDTTLQIADQLAKNKNSALQSAVTASNQDAAHHITAMQQAAESSLSQIRAHVESHCKGKIEQVDAVVAAIESSLAQLSNLTRHFSTTIDEALAELSDLEDERQRLNQVFETGIQSILASRAPQRPTG